MPASRFFLICAVFGILAVLPISTPSLAAEQLARPQRPVATPAKWCAREMRPGHGLQRFIDSLRPGRPGCLPPGDYTATKLTFGHSGRPDAPITLRSTDPDRAATIHGVVWLRDDANYVTLDDLAIVGDSEVLPAVIVNGDNSVWDRIDVSNPAGICISLGNVENWGYAGNTTVENSRIHDCGKSNNTNHGIYAQATSGRTLIRNNWIFRNGDRGVQLYPDAQNVVVSHNVINGNGSGVIFGGDDVHASHDNQVSDNVISNSIVRWNVESSYPAAGVIGRKNIVAHNCVWASGSNAFYDTSGGISAPFGYSVSGNNVVQRPRFEAAAIGDLRLRAESGCRGYGLTTVSPPGPRSARTREADVAHANATR